MDLDTAATAALDAGAIDPEWYCWLDVVGDPLWATTAGENVTFDGTGDPELDGKTFVALDPRAVSVSDVVAQEGGSETVTCRLSGLLEIDADVLATMADKANWQGRTARLWLRIKDENGAVQGAVAAYYTGYMVALDILPSPEEQVIELKIENYLALLTRASGRTYLSQSRYDPADTSAQATIGAANGARPNGQSTSAGGGGLIGVKGPGFAPLLDSR